MSLLRRLFGEQKTQPVEEEPQVRWLKPHDHDGSPFNVIPSERTWQGDTSPMVTRAFELTAADGAILHSSNCGVTRWPALGLYHFKVAGEAHRPSEDISLATIGSAAVLRPEPTNPYDADAIRVETPSGVHIGYVPAKNTKSARRVMRTEPVHVCFWANHLERGQRIIAVEVMVWRPGTLSGLADVPQHPPWSE